MTTDRNQLALDALDNRYETHDEWVTVQAIVGLDNYETIKAALTAKAVTDDAPVYYCDNGNSLEGLEKAAMAVLSNLLIKTNSTSAEFMIGNEKDGEFYFTCNRGKPASHPCDCGAQNVPDHFVDANNMVGVTDDECPYCGGDGHFSDYSEQQSAGIIECQKCDGKGVLSATAPKYEYAELKAMNDRLIDDCIKSKKECDALVKAVDQVLDWLGDELFDDDVREKRFHETTQEERAENISDMLKKALATHRQQQEGK